MVEKKLTLSEEQAKWVQDQLGLDPKTLSDAQGEHIIKYWENKPYRDFVRQRLDAKWLKLGTKIKKDQLDEYYGVIRQCDQEWASEKEKEEREFRALFPPRELSVEEEVLQEEIAKAMQKSADMHDKLFTPIMDIPKAEWIIQGIAVKEGITLLFGEPGAGKTSLMLQLIAAAQVGMPFVGIGVSKVTTLLVEQDENPGMLRGHIERMLPMLPSLRYLEVPNGTVLWDTNKGSFSDNTLGELIQYSGMANLVIIDSLTSLGIEDINHPRCSLVFDALRRLARAWRCAFIVIHHPNKGGDVMGSKLIHAKVDVMLRLETGKLIFEKLRGGYPAGTVIDGKEQPYLPIVQDPTTLVFRVDRETCIRGLKQAGVPRADAIRIIMVEYGGSKEAVSKAYDRVKEDG